MNLFFYFILRNNDLECLGQKGITNPMAQLDQRYEDNVAGRFYVDEACIICGLCNEVAPDHFRESENGGYNIVYSQPTNSAEIELVMEALDQCPVESIGDGGVTAESSAT